MYFLEAQISQPKTPAKLKNNAFEFDVKDIHPIDQMGMHKQTGEIISSTLTSTTMSLSKLQVSLANFQSQLKMKNISSLAKDTRIKSLEDLVINIGYDPTNVKAVKEILKKKNADIAALRKNSKSQQLKTL